MVKSRTRPPVCERTWSFTWVPSLPLMRPTLTSSDTPFVGWPSTATMASPALMPACWAGDPSNTRVMSSLPSFFSRAAPTPEYDPCVSSCRVWLSCGVMYTVHGSCSEWSRPAMPAWES